MRRQELLHVWLGQELLQAKLQLCRAEALVGGDEA